MADDAEHNPDQPTQDQRAQDAQYYRRVLHGLIDMGNDIACLLHEQIQLQAKATQPAADPDPAKIDPGKPTNTGTIVPSAPAMSNLALAFDRVTRGVRLSLLLGAKFAEPAKAHTAREPAHRTAEHKSTLRDLEDIIDRRTRALNEAECLDAEIRDRLDHPDLECDPAKLPDKILEYLCRDLSPNDGPGADAWTGHTSEDLAPRAATMPPGQPPLKAMATSHPPEPYPPHDPPRPAGHCRSTDPP